MRSGLEGFRNKEDAGCWPRVGFGLADMIKALLGWVHLVFSYGYAPLGHLSLLLSLWVRSSVALMPHFRGLSSIVTEGRVRSSKLTEHGKRINAANRT